MREIWKGQQNLIARNLSLSDLLVQSRNSVADLAGFFLSRFGVLGFFLRHQGANLFRNTIALGLELLNLRQELAALLIKSQHLPYPVLLPGPAAGQPFADEIRLLANDPDVQHRRIIK